MASEEFDYQNHQNDRILAAPIICFRNIPLGSGASAAEIPTKIGMGENFRKPAYLEGQQRDFCLSAEEGGHEGRDRLSDPAPDFFQTANFPEDSRFFSLFLNGIG